MQTILHTRRKASKKATGIGTLLKYSEQMQKEPTPSEVVALNALAAGPHNVETQVVFGFYILDFVVPAKLVCVEIDGSSHDGKGAYDERRDKFIKRHGIKVLRIPASEAATALAQVQALPNVANCKQKWQQAQDSAIKERGRAIENQESISQSGRKKGFVKPLYTPRKEQAHVQARQRKRAHLASGNNSSAADLAARKQEREARQAATKERLGL